MVEDTIAIVPPETSAITLNITQTKPPLRLDPAASFIPSLDMKYLSEKCKTVNIICPNITGNDKFTIFLKLFVL